MDRRATRVMLASSTGISRKLAWLPAFCWFVTLCIAPAQETAKAPPANQPKISAEAAKELLGSVDEILRFASKDTGFPIRSDVKRRLTSRDEVVAYLEKHMAEDGDAQRLERADQVLKKFGLLPRDFDLKKFLLALLREQVAGYYSPETKTVNLLDWTDPAQQKPVLAHELTHALQDQDIGLEKWMKSGSALDDNKGPVTLKALAADEASTARQAVVEGQAMVVLVDYMLAPNGASLLDSPQIAEALKQGMLVGTADSVQYRSAPVYLKETLIFPYRYGMDFIAEVLRKGGKQRAYHDLLVTPPITSRQIMEPATYLSGEQLPPMPLPDLGRIFRNYERLDAGSFGEFDVGVLVDEYAGADAGRQIYPHWRGGYYYAARPKNDHQAPLGILFVTRWSGPDAATKFAAIYAQSLTKRYRRAREAAAESAPALDLGKLPTLTGTHTWLTEEGPVVIDVVGDLVMVTESLDPATTEELQKALFYAAAK